MFRLNSMYANKWHNDQDRLFLATNKTFNFSIDLNFGKNGLFSIINQCPIVFLLKFFL